MTKGEFLHELRVRLAVLPEDDIDRTVYYYGEIIDDMTEDGKTEQEAIEELESVDEIAQRIISETPNRVHMQNTRQVVEEKRPKTGVVILILLIVLFPLWIGLFIAAWAIAIAFFAGSGSCILAGICGIPVSFLLMADGMVIKGVFALGTCVFSAGFGIIWLIGNIYYTKALVKFIGFICRRASF
ncbi:MULTISPECIES: DUF1700 domain-containing protein [unclassified Ruminococcus]|uniref:DUF1700 domain-containing protein n=1 Tax=unclassified Ruminococcus TaxID=2608920 RepID=UPI00210867EF|nr:MULTISPECIES: DUF1700 domain-containing protein [unclassified Ruminococcus]